eukprot:m.239188 g.239188  ORF g.239188 m.239188 type:complete len:200 (+) comp40176_c1_seq36:896-1495(+)
MNCRSLVFIYTKNELDFYLQSSCVISSEDIQGTVIGGWKPTYLYKVSISVFPLKDCSTNPLFTGTNMTWHSKCGSDECLPNPPAPANVDFMTMKEDSTGKMDVNVTWTIGKTKAPIIKSIVYVFWPSPSEGVTHCHTDKNPKQTWCFIRSLPSHLVFTARVCTVTSMYKYSQTPIIQTPINQSSVIAFLRSCDAVCNVR